MFKTGSGNGTQYRQLPCYIEVDFHRSEYGRREISYCEAMDEVYSDALEALRDAHQQGRRYVIFTHGYSTSRRGETTARSQVRKLMRSSDATPYIVSVAERVNFRYRERVVYRIAAFGSYGTLKM